jgi:hypothetical protein
LIVNLVKGVVDPPQSLVDGLSDAGIKHAVGGDTLGREKLKLILERVVFGAPPPRRRVWW